MLIEIKNGYTGIVLYSGEHELIKDAVVAGVKAKVYLSKANLRGCDLSGCDLSGCDFREANLRGSDLRGSDLSGCDLSGCDFREANLRGCDLRGSDLRGCNLREANLYVANLRGCDLRGSDLRGCNLREANLYVANLSEANLDPIAIACLSICPDGDLIGWKKIREGICKLLIPSNARRSNATGRKCRAEFAIVLELPEGCTEGHSLHDREFVYRVGETVRPTEPFCEDPWQECASGIHFYITREEAEAHS